MSVWDSPDDLANSNRPNLVPINLMSVLDQMSHARELNLVQDYIDVTTKPTEPLEPLNLPTDLFNDRPPSGTGSIFHEVEVPSTLETVELSDPDLVHPIWQVDASDDEDSPGVPGTPRSRPDLSDLDNDPHGQIQALAERITTRLGPSTDPQQNSVLIQQTDKPKRVKKYYMCADCHELHSDSDTSDDSRDY